MDSLQTKKTNDSKNFTFLFGDILSLLIFAFITVFLLIPTSRQWYVNLNSSHPYLLGFIKVGILATFGEILALRIVKSRYVVPVGVFYRFIIWGFLGIVFVAVFELFGSGTKVLLDKHLLPYIVKWKTFFQAFYTSVLMNLIFAPTFMAFHRITDAIIDLSNGSLLGIKSVKLSEALKYIDWNIFVNFVLLKTIPFFWIPAHTITFLLPGSYRVLVAALLSVALGIILSFRKKIKNS
ncbi:MAG: hypothetical protein ACK4R7_05105 [Fervidobacterium sp.]